MCSSKRIRPEDIPAQVVDLCRVLSRHGFRGWVVGGCLRDLLRGVPASDWDLATDARPEQVQAIFPRVIPTGIQHGTVTVRQRGESFELTTLRGEGAYSDGRRPDSVQFVSEIQDDLGRRDFTINALAYDPVGDQLEDPYGGLRDLGLGLIRAVGEPARRFGEDGLRVLRAARFSASLEFELEPETEAAIRPTLETFRRVSGERVRDEWLKALKARAASRAFQVMRRTGILEVTYAELAALSDTEFEHTLASVDDCRPEPILRLAALLFSQRGEPKQVAEWLNRYRFSNLERERVLRLLAHAAPEGSDGFSDGAVRRFAATVGRDALGEVSELGVVLSRSWFARDTLRAGAAERLATRLSTLIRPETPLSTRELALTGRDLMRELSLAPGPRVGKLLELLLTRVLEAPELNHPEKLIELARLAAAEE